MLGFADHSKRHSLEELYHAVVVSSGGAAVECFYVGSPELSCVWVSGLHRCKVAFVADYGND